MCSSDLYKWQKGLIWKVNQERHARIEDESPADIEKQTKLLYLAEGIIKQCQREKVICDTDLFTNLQVVVLLNMPRYRDDYESSRILSDYIKYIEQDEDSMHKMKLDAVVIMQIYELIFSIYANHEDLEGMQDILVRAKKASSCFHRKEA